MQHIERAGHKRRVIEFENPPQKKPKFVPQLP